jgi:hypothetical protein
MYIGILILFIGWIGLIIISLSYQFKDNEQGKPYLKSLPKIDPDNPSRTSTPE